MNNLNELKSRIGVDRNFLPTEHKFYALSCDTLTYFARIKIIILKKIQSQTIMLKIWQIKQNNKIPNKKNAKEK